MYTENIIRDLQDLIHDVKQAHSRAYENRKEAARTFNNVVEGFEGTIDSYETVSDGLVDASQALDKAGDDFMSIEEVLLKIIEDINMEELSHKVQSK
jgi:ABC-type transporter Mla subunit MlaD